MTPNAKTTTRDDEATFPPIDIAAQACDGCGVLPGQEHKRNCPVYLANLAAASQRSEPRAENVIVALQRVMRDLPAIGKDGQADPAQGGYAFRGIEAITGHAQVLLAEHGVTFVPRVLSWERDTIVVGRDHKEWHDERLLVEYDVYGPGGIDDKITVGPIAAIGRDGADKGTNKCMTQAFKYALLQVLCISDKADDTDGKTVEASRQQRDVDPENDPATPAQIRSIREHVRTLRALGIEVTDQQGDTLVVDSVPVLFSDPESGTTRPACTMAVADDLVSRLMAMEASAAPFTEPAATTEASEGVVAAEGDTAAAEST